MKISQPCPPKKPRDGDGTEGIFHRPESLSQLWAEHGAQHLLDALFTLLFVGPRFGKEVLKLQDVGAENAASAAMPVYRLVGRGKLLTGFIRDRNRDTKKDRETQGAHVVLEFVSSKLRQHQPVNPRPLNSEHPIDT